MDSQTLFTLRYETCAGEVTKTLTRSDLVFRDGPTVNRLGDAGKAVNIAVLDEDGVDVTTAFACFT
ncbi:hypothetical protein ACWGOK_39160 [Streptomyces eurythermus]